MGKLLFILGAIVCSYNFSSAQITFQKTLGGTAYDGGTFVQQTTDGGYIITGTTESFGAGDGDAYLMKTDANGNSLWYKTFGGTNYESGVSVQQTTDGGYIIAGTTASFSNGLANVYLIKTNSDGDSLWTRTFGGTNDDPGYSVKQATDGGYIIAGWTTSYGAALYDVYLIKADANGDLVWSKTFGGYTPDIGTSVEQTIDGGYIVAGYTRSFGLAYYDVYLIKTNSDGDSLWTKTYGGPGIEWCSSVQQTADGGYIIVGETQSFGAGGWDVFLMKTDVDGNWLWAKSFGGTNDEYGYSVQQTTDGGYIITGYTNSFGAGASDVYLIKTDANGDSLWTKTFGGTNDDRGNTVVQSTDGGYIITGSTYSFGSGNSDVYLIKTDSLGNSGCNEGNPATFVTTPQLIELNTATEIYSPSSNMNSTQTIVGSGGNVNTICETTGIKDVTSENYFLLSPNPSQGNFMISFEDVINKGNVEISNILGEKVFANTIFNESRKEINLENISGGFYFVKVIDGEKTFTQKIIIQE